MLFPPEVRTRICREALAAARAELSLSAEAPLLGACLEVAWQGYLLLSRWPGAPRVILQAGSVCWPRVPPGLDDGVSNTHFSYVWDDHSPVALLLKAGATPVLRRADGKLVTSLPEMHVWLAFPQSQTLVDFTTGFLPETCEASTGEPWLAPRPPEHLWLPGSELPDAVRYEASRGAIDCLCSVLRRQGRRYP